MNILYISEADVSKTSGPSINERQFIVSLYRLIGDKAHFLVPDPETEAPEDMPLSQITFYKSSNGKKPHLWIAQQFSLISKANYLIKNNQFDMIIIRAGVFPFAFNHIIRKHNIPFALKTAGSGEFKVFKKKSFFIRSLYTLNQKQYKKLVNNAILVDVVSESQRESLSKITGAKEKIVWIDNGVDTVRFQPMNQEQIKKEMGLDKFNPIIGYAGNFPWKRGAMQMVKALPALKEKYPNIGIVSLGSGDGMSQLYDKAIELNISDYCVFTGQIPFEQVVKYINCMDVGISQLYIDEQGASEQKVRQYLSCGKPIIVSPGGVNDFVEDEGLGYVVDPSDEDAFIESVSSILSLDTKEYTRISIKAREYAENHLSYESKVIERLNRYKKILNK